MLSWSDGVQEKEKEKRGGVLCVDGCGVFSERRFDVIFWEAEPTVRCRV